MLCQVTVMIGYIFHFSLHCMSSAKQVSADVLAALAEP